MYNQNTDKSVQNLNGIWKSYVQKPGEEIIDAEQVLHKKGWQKVYLPFFWQDRDYDGITWYKHEFSLIKRLHHSRMALCFDFLDDQTEIFINGQLVAKHNGYHVKAGYDITNIVNAEDKNSVVLKITDSGGSGRVLGNVYIKEYSDKKEIQPVEFQAKADNPCPEWTTQGIIYELYVRSHSEKGDFNSVRLDLYRLKQLGVKVIWLMPIYPVGQQNKKGSLGCPYATADYQNVSSEYGSLLDFYNLVKEAHRLDIKVILDIVLNHTAWDNWILEKHGDWFAQDWDNHIISPPGTDWHDVAQLDYSNPELRAFIIGVMEYWIKEMDIDGYRCDVAEMVPGDFWDEATTHLKSIKPDILMLAEGSHPSLIQDGFHMTYAWNTRNVMVKILNQNVSARRFHQTIIREMKQLPAETLPMRFIENHDLPRSASVFEADKAKLAAVMVFCLPGVPMIYAGQEVSATYLPSLFERELIDWQNDDSDNWKFYQALSLIRKRFSSLRKGSYIHLKNNKETKVISYARSEKKNVAIIVGNTDEKTLKVKIKTSEIFPSQKTNWERVFGDVKVDKSEGDLILTIPGRMYCILVSEVQNKMRKK